MRDEGAEVVGDEAAGLPDSQAAALLVDQPEAQDGVPGGAGGAVVGEGAGGGEGLEDGGAGVGAAGGGDGLAVADDGDVGALAGEERLADVAARRAGGALEVG